MSDPADLNIELGEPDAAPEYQSSWNRNHVEQLREMQRQFRISIGGTKHPVGAPALGANTFAPPTADDDKISVGGINLIVPREPAAAASGAADGQPLSASAGGKRDLASLKKEIEMDDHKIPVADFYAKWQVTLEAGLSDAQVLKNRAAYGRNEMTPPAIVPAWVRFLKQMVNGFAILLWIGAGLSFLAFGLDPEKDYSNFYLAWALIVTIVVTGTFAFYQEGKSDDVMANFKRMLPPQSTVIRNGVKVQVEASDLVPGDVTIVQFGDKLPADMRLMKASSVSVDNSSLTGESEPQTRSTECTHDNPLETKNMVFCGTSCVQGTCTGVVVFTGDSTLIGRIAGLASGVEQLDTPIANEIHDFVIKISVIAVTVGVVFVAIGFGKGYAALKNILFGIGIIVANVPEGLVATVTVCLTHAAHKMAAKNVLVKNLEGVETLGSTNTICSDKTGTLTQNRMTVQHMYFDGAVHTTLEADAGVYPAVQPRVQPTFDALWRVGVLCNRASFKTNDVETPIALRETFGDATESGLIKYFEPLETITALKTKYEQVFGVPFNSKEKYQLSLHAQPGSDRLLLVFKGAPERILERCQSIMLEGREQPLNAELRAAVAAGNEALGELGERVLGFAHYELPAEFTRAHAFDEDALDFPIDRLCFVGLISLLDPPRPGVKEAVHSCSTASVKVIMVTGDHPITAAAIARQVGIIRGDTIEDIAKRLGVAPADMKTYFTVTEHATETIAAQAARLGVAPNDPRLVHVVSDSYADRAPIAQRLGIDISNETQLCDERISRVIREEAAARLGVDADDARVKLRTVDGVFAISL